MHCHKKFPEKLPVARRCKQELIHKKHLFTLYTFTKQSRLPKIGFSCYEFNMVARVKRSRRTKIILLGLIVNNGLTMRKQRAHKLIIFKRRMHCIR